MKSIYWHTISKEPVITPGQLNGKLDAERTAGAYVVALDDKYMMYYWATGADGVNRICLAEAPVDSPNNWQGCGEILGPQPETEYNCRGPVCPAVLPRKDEPWLLYSGTNGPVPGQWYSGLAISEDQGRK